MLKINKIRPFDAVSIDSFIPSNDSPKNHPEGRGYKIKYIVNNVIITNDGDTPIENCEGYILKDNKKLRLSWSIPLERANTTINPAGDKELEVCALMNTSLGEFNTLNDTALEAAALEQLVARLKAPYLSSPTEAGFQSPPTLNRAIKSGKYKLFVSGKNPDPLIIRIIIHDKFLDHQGTFISLDQD